MLSQFVRIIAFGSFGRCVLKINLLTGQFSVDIVLWYLGKMNKLKIKNNILLNEKEKNAQISNKINFRMLITFIFSYEVSVYTLFKFPQWLPIHDTRFL